MNACAGELRHAFRKGSGNEHDFDVGERLCLGLKAFSRNIKCERISVDANNFDAPFKTVRTQTFYIGGGVPSSSEGAVHPNEG